MELRDEVLSSIGAQEMDTNGYPMSNMEDIGFHWKVLDMNMDTLFWPGQDNIFSLLTSTDFGMGSRPENWILINNEVDRKNSSPLWASQKAEKFSSWNENRKESWICLNITVWPTVIFFLLSVFFLKKLNKLLQFVEIFYEN